MTVGVSARAMRRDRKVFRLFALLIGAAALFLALILPGMNDITREEKRMLQEASSAYLRAQNEYKRLSELVAGANDREYVEKVARRKHGYVLYGETVYKVANLDELLSKPDFEVYGSAVGGEE